MAERRSERASGGAATLSELEFFPGMVWPVPLSFAGAISGMRFEQGDVLYREASAYEALDGKIPKGLRAIQVLLPQRSTRGIAGDSSTGDRRLSNWQSDVTIELIDLERSQSKVRTISQGKLAMALFSGEEKWLDPEHDEPPVPGTARDLQQRLDQSIGYFDSKRKSRGGSRFLFVVDLASDSSRTKASGVEDALRAGGAVDRIDLSPFEAGIEDASRFHPTLVVRGLVLPGRSSDEVLPLLRDRLYGGGGAGEPAVGETTSDRFSIGRHGIFQSFD